MTSASCNEEGDSDEPGDHVITAMPVDNVAVVRPPGGAGGGQRGLGGGGRARGQGDVHGED